MSWWGCLQLWISVPWESSHSFSFSLPISMFKGEQQKVWIWSEQTVTDVHTQYIFTNWKYKCKNTKIQIQSQKGEEQKCIVHSLKARWTNINAQIKIHNNTNTKVVAKCAFSLKDYWTNTRPTVQTVHCTVCIGEKSEAWKSVQVFIWLDVNEWWGLIVGIVLVQSLDFDQITGNNIRYRHSIAMTLSFIKKV